MRPSLLRCPHCGSRYLQARLTAHNTDNTVITRYRECRDCHRRFWTKERVVEEENSSGCNSTT